MDSITQEMRNLCTTTATSSMFDLDTISNISASEAALLVAQGEKIHADQNFQGSQCDAIWIAYKELKANKDFFQNLDFGPTHQPIPPNFSDFIEDYTNDNTTIDTNSVNHLLDTTLDTVETTGDNTNSSSSVNPI
ncbi:hypothetical protein ACA910_012519 [Epithemia clementina (nom. ined.)]